MTSSEADARARHVVEQVADGLNLGHDQPALGGLFVDRHHQNRQAARPGLYCRVIQPGLIRVGEQVRVESYQAETISVAQMFADYYEKDKSEATLRLHLQAPIAIRARVDIEQALQKRLAQG